MYNKLPIKERMDLMKSYRKANPDMSYRDMVNDYNTSYQKFSNGGEFNIYDDDGSIIKNKISKNTLAKGERSNQDNTRVSNLPIKTLQALQQQADVEKAARQQYKEQPVISQGRKLTPTEQAYSDKVQARIVNPSNDLGIIGANVASALTRFRYLNPEEIAATTNNPMGTIKLSSNIMTEALANEMVGPAFGKALTSATKIIKKVPKELPKELPRSFNKKYVLPSKEKIKDLHGFIPRRQFVKEMQKEGLIGKDFKDLNYAASSTDKTNALTKLALNRQATRYRGVAGSVPENGIYKQQSVPYGTFDMTKPGYGNDISAFEHMKNAGVDFNDPISIAKYQASHIPMHKYEYRSGMPKLGNVDALYSGHAPTGYGNYQIKMTSPRDYSEGNYIDWVKKYHNPKNNLQDLAVKDGYYVYDFVPSTSYEMPIGLNKTDLTTVVGKRGQKMFDVDDTFPFMNYKKLNPKQELEFKDYVKRLAEDYNTGWKGKYKYGGIQKKIGK